MSQNPYRFTIKALIAAKYPNAEDQYLFKLRILKQTDMSPATWTRILNARLHEAQKLDLVTATFIAECLEVQVTELINPELAAITKALPSVFLSK